MSFHLLFLQNSVASFFKKGSGGAGSGNGEPFGGTSLLQPVAEKGGDSLVLMIFVYIQPVQIACGSDITEAQNLSSFYGKQGVMLGKRLIPGLQIYRARGPGLQLLGRIVGSVDRMDRIVE